MLPAAHRAEVLTLFAALGLLGCAPCPAVDAVRPDLGATPSAHLRLALRGNRLAQANERPAVLTLDWGAALAGELVVTDAGGVVRLRRSVDAGASGLRWPLANGGSPLGEGIYLVELVANGERASASFEICHCTVYY